MEKNSSSPTSTVAPHCAQSVYHLQIMRASSKRYVVVLYRRTNSVVLLPGDVLSKLDAAMFEKGF